MKVPPGVKEYEESIRKAKSELNRLKKGSSMLQTAISNREMVNAWKIIRTWQMVSESLFTQLELATIIHQQYLTGNSVVVKSNGRLEKVENIMDMNPSEIDPWTLLTIQKMHEIFGEEYKEFMEIKRGESPIN